MKKACRGIFIRWTGLAEALITFAVAAVIIVLGPMDAFSHGYVSDAVDPFNISGEDFLGNVNLDDGPYTFAFAPTQNHFRGFEVTMINVTEESVGEVIVSVSDESGSVLGEASFDICGLKAMEYYSVYLEDIGLRKGRTYYCTIEAADYDNAPYLMLVDGAYLGDEVEGDEVLVGFVYAESTFSFPEKVMISAMLLVVWLLVTAQLLCAGSVKITNRNFSAEAGHSGLETIHAKSADLQGQDTFYEKSDNSPEQAISCGKSENPPEQKTACTKEMSAASWMRRLNQAALFLCLVTILTWDYMYYPFFSVSDGEAFQQDSETLVAGVIMAEEQGAGLGAYGLGRYSTGGGEIVSYDSDGYINDGNWIHGYSASQPQFIVENTEYQRSIYVAGYEVEFESGLRYTITGAEESDNYLIVTINASGSLNYYKLGELSEITIYNTEGSAISEGSLQSYTSQYGLQGRIFRHLARLIRSKEVSGETLYERLHFLCAFAMAVVVCLITFLLHRKYNFLMATCWYGVCLLSQWVVYFADDLYWVEFTWFLPMLAGLVCSMHIRDRRWRIGCYVAAFLSIAVKSLCGYEYISTIMVGLIAFPAADFVKALFRHDNVCPAGVSRSMTMDTCAAVRATASDDDSSNTQISSDIVISAAGNDTTSDPSMESDAAVKASDEGSVIMNAGISSEQRGKEHDVSLALLLRTIVLLGCAALLGFVLAFAVHASIRGDGDLIAGVQAIYENDYLRIMSGGDGSNFSSTYETALNASVWETVQKYFRFSTDVIVGIPANLFLILCCAPLVIFALEVHKDRKYSKCVSDGSAGSVSADPSFTGTFRPEEAALYAMFLFGTLSWFVLGKSHSYIHTHINYVLWYLGFVQTCCYIILRPFYERWKER